MQSLLVLGRQPALGLAELESLYGASQLRPVGANTALLDIDPCLVEFNRLGGSVKFCKLLTTLDTTLWRDIQDFLVAVAPQHARTMPEGKMTLGLSAYGLEVSLSQMEATGLSVKKVIRESGRPVRLVPNKQLQLSSAQVIHNKLTGPRSWELVFVRDGARSIVAQTLNVQDIAAYARRDRQRPKRDAKVGMLPPKLAQIIINLASGAITNYQLPITDNQPGICYDDDYQSKLHALNSNLRVLDPFCGSGVILQEALLMGYSVSGTDLEPRMIDYSRANLEWLRDGHHLVGNHHLTAADAIDYRWEQPIDMIASEVYLGRPFTSPPGPEILAQTASDCDLIIKKFLRNIHNQLKPTTRLCLAVPAWQISPGRFKHLPLVDRISQLGYNRVSFEHLRDQDLVYCREGQIVARQLLVLNRL